MKCLSIIGQEYQTPATSHIERFGSFVSFVKKKIKIRKLNFLTFCRLIGFLKKNKIISN